MINWRDITTLPHPLAISTGSLTHPALDKYIQSLGKHGIVITDDNVKTLYGDTLADRLQVPLISIPPGEPNKSRQSKVAIEDRMQALSLGRDCVIIALGGGVITDLVGFVAATYGRGVPVVYLPTTLLAMVDAAIGGKTAINTTFAKNSIGLIRQPNSVIIDPACLLTLQNEQRLEGLSECIKHAIIADENYFHYIHTHLNSFLTTQTTHLEKLIHHSINIKSRVVMQDCQESGLRSILNCGHTIGHAIEQASDYTISHGHAVQIGLMIEAKMAYKMNILAQTDYTKIVSLLKKLAFPVIQPGRLKQDKILLAMQQDKKNKADQIQFVLPQSIGQTYQPNGQYTCAIKHEVLHQCVSDFISQQDAPCSHK